MASVVPQLHGVLPSDAIENGAAEFEPEAMHHWPREGLHPGKFVVAVDRVCAEDVGAADERPITLLLGAVHLPQGRLDDAHCALGGELRLHALCEAEGELCDALLEALCLALRRQAQGDAPDRKERGDADGRRVLSASLVGLHRIDEGPGGDDECATGRPAPRLLENEALRPEAQLNLAAPRRRLSRVDVGQASGVHIQQSRCELRAA
mmetsp:Transcript_59712/g.194921  ORF Transcript_59712/g.194921 Transcript_59712/m.194921 type:complete len:208 (+) Transcript_59712:656-1279(+)